MYKRKLLTDGSKSYSKRVKRVKGFRTTSMVRYRQPSTFNRCVIATTITDTIDLTTADGFYGYGFAPAKLWINGVSSFNYPTNIINIWDLCRVVKVEITVSANSNSADFSSSTVPLIPYAFDAFDPNDNNAPVSITEIQQNSTCQMFRLDGVRKRTIYPAIQAQNVIDTGSNRKNRFINASVDAPMNGYKLVIDQPPSHQSQVTDVRVCFKVFMEVMSSV